MSEFPEFEALKAKKVCVGGGLEIPRIPLSTPYPLLKNTRAGSLPDGGGGSEAGGDLSQEPQIIVTNPVCGPAVFTLGAPELGGALRSQVLHQQVNNGA
jgi:hypothetical protein